MAHPFFSVIIPTHNRAGYLRDAMQSALDQTFHDFELIIVDDHSSDNTHEVVREFNDCRIKYTINERTIGGAGARNTGICKAKGEWIAFLDDDDVWLPKKLEMQFKKIQEMDKSVGFVYTGYATYDFENKKELKSYLPEKEGWIQSDLLYDNYITALPSVTVQRDILLKIGGFDEEFSALQDWELYVRISCFTKVSFIKEVLTHIRISNIDRISINLKNKLKSALLLREKHKKSIGRSPILLHKTASRIFLWALEVNDWFTALKAFPWTIAGIIFHPYNFVKCMKWAILIRYKKSKKSTN